MKRFIYILTLLSLANYSAAQSLYSETQYKSLVADPIAKQIGDSVTVLVIETSKAKTNAQDQDSGSLDVGGRLSTTGRSEQGSIGLNLGYDTGSTNTRGGELRAQISVDIKQQDQLGRLYIEGRQEIVVDGEEQFLSISGWIRPEHIMSNNTILSTRISNSKIEYTGYDTEEEGFFSRFLSWIGF